MEEAPTNPLMNWIEKKDEVDLFSTLIESVRTVFVIN